MSEPAPAVARVGERWEEARCGCGMTFQQRLLDYGGEKPLRHPSRCALCVQVEAEEISLQQKLREERERQGSLEQRRALLAIPPLYAEARLDNFREAGPPAARGLQRRALRFAQSWLQSWPKPPLLCGFIGAPGSGKTWLAWALARAVVEERGGSARVLKLSELVRSLRATWRRDSASSEESVLRELRSPSLLVVDEASRHAFYGAPTQHLYDVLDARLWACRPTILTSNEEDDGLLSLLGPALQDRLDGHGGLLEFGSYSWRKSDD